MASTLASDEQKFVENGFGVVTSRRVIYYRAKGWFSGGSREDIPLQHVTSVRLETARGFLSGTLLLLVGLVLLLGDGGIKVVGVSLILLAILLFWGSPTVVVNTAGRDLNASKGLPWKRADANAFVEALRAQLFKNASA